jgi:hypothetical protein
MFTGSHDNQVIFGFWGPDVLARFNDVFDLIPKAIIPLYVVLAKFPGFSPLIPHHILCKPADVTTNAIQSDKLDGFI